MTSPRAKARPGITEKVAHVRRAGQSRRHACHWPGCDRQVPPAKWGCTRHWYALPQVFRDRIWQCYRPGQEIDGRPSEAYLEVAREVQDWIAATTSAAASAPGALGGKGPGFRLGAAQGTLAVPPPSRGLGPDVDQLDDAPHREGGASRDDRGRRARARAGVASRDDQGVAR